MSATFTSAVCLNKYFLEDSVITKKSCNDKCKEKGLAVALDKFKHNSDAAFAVLSDLQ